MNIGVFGGTFNPIHYGHLVNVELIRDEFGLDMVLFIPAKRPVHKGLDFDVSGEQRFRMVELAIQGNPSFKASRVEIDRDQPSYTVTTLESLQNDRAGDELFLIIGEDSLNDLSGWKNPEEIVKLSRLIVMKRKDDPFVTPTFIGKGDRIEFAHNPVIDISSTMIRERIVKGLSVRYLLPDMVIEYINTLELYRA